ncbi:type IV secretion system DNA-binding domain-containing protein [Candidatus Gracilibacteria bacterium]|nr:type IV secretion system DNA-binding domain-containing protein [Candidatus Gracilibacteria bacterium]
MNLPSDYTMDKTVLEILVDRKNEKGPGVFEHVLIVLHKVYDDFPKTSWFKRGNTDQPSFSLEITKIGNRIRFFLVTPKKYQNFLKNQIYAHYNDVEISEVGDYLEHIPSDKIFIGQAGLTKHQLYPIKTFTELQEDGSNETVDPYSSITSALGRTGKYSLNMLQINFAPAHDASWKKKLSETVKVLTSGYPKWMKNILLHPAYGYFKILFFPFIILGKIISLFTTSAKTEESVPEGEEKVDKTDDNASSTRNVDDKNVEIPKGIFNKISLNGYTTSVVIAHAGEDPVEARAAVKEIYSTLAVFSNFGQNSFQFHGMEQDTKSISAFKARNMMQPFILSTNELSGLAHFPTSYVKTPQINWVAARAFEPPSNLPIIDPDLTDDIIPETNLTPLGKTNFRGTNMSFGMGPNDRRRHVYIIGKTGMGKSTLLENMVIDDIRKGRGVAVIDPHGDLAETVIGFIPKSRTNQTIIFDPSDTEWPIAFNMLDDVKSEHRPLVASGLVGIFKKIFGDSWGPRLEHILRNTILALLEYPNTTLISIPLMLTSEVFRNKVVAKVSDPIVKKFWTGEFAKMAPNQKVEAAGPILNKVGQFLSSTILRNVLGQPKNSFSVRWAMDNKKIIIVNLSKGKIGEDASALLGAMMVTKFQMDAMSRADMPEEKREDFYLYVDEFQNFATDSFATILSEARKYKLNLVMANQYIDQMQESVRGAVFGNVGSLVSFQVGYHDASILKEVFSGEISTDDLINTSKYNIYLKQLIDGMPSPTFSAGTFAPNKKDDDVFSSRYNKILTVSREKYSKPRDTVQKKIAKMIEDIEQKENEWEKKKEDFKNKKQEEKRKAHEEKMAKQDQEKQQREVSSE